MAYESSYESGRQPFLPDSKRGHWANPNDFVYASISFVFNFYSFLWFRLRVSGVITFVFVYSICSALFILPFIVVQSFLGQFSSSGHISAFRIAPLFKGIGYVTLALNICVLAYFSVFATVPLFYMFASMNPTLPWSCEGFKTWATNLTEEESTNLCNLRLANESSPLEGSGSGENETEYERFVNHHIPSFLYFTKTFHDVDLLLGNDMDFEMSWQLIICTLIVWTLVAFVLYKLFNTEVFGTMVRYCVWTTMGLMCLFIVRFSFIPGAGQVYRQSFVPTWRQLAATASGIPFFSLSALGPGWGHFISISSFNKFKTNIIKSSWLIGVGQMFVVVGIHLLIAFADIYFGEVTDDRYYSVANHVWILYLSSASAMVHMEWANMWSILFYFMLFLSAMTMMVVQLKSILTTIYDEFVFLREKRIEVSISLLGFLAASSLYFTSNHGISYFTALASDSFITQNSLNFLLILVVLWIYGRVRFQRDIEFMINQRFSTWFVNLLRFGTPLAFGLGWLFGILVSYYEHLYSSWGILVIALIFLGLPWLCIPGYAIYQMRMGIGSLKTRFFRCCHPTDWFPVELEHRQKYDQAVGNAEINQTFSELRDQDGA